MQPQWQARYRNGRRDLGIFPFGTVPAGIWDIIRVVSPPTRGSQPAWYLTHTARISLPGRVGYHAGWDLSARTSYCMPCSATGWHTMSATLLSRAHDTTLTPPVESWSHPRLSPGQTRHSGTGPPCSVAARAALQRLHISPFPSGPVRCMLACKCKRPHPARGHRPFTHLFCWRRRFFHGTDAAAPLKRAGGPSLTESIRKLNR